MTSPPSGLRTLSLTLTDELDAPYTTRALLSALLPHWRVTTELCERALLVASELVAHAVAGSDGDGLVLLEAALHADRLELAVADRAPCAPGQRTAEEPAPVTGGLQLVSRLARHWGLEPCARGGTRAFAVLDRDPLPV